MDKPAGPAPDDRDGVVRRHYREIERSVRARYKTSDGNQRQLRALGGEHQPILVVIADEILGHRFSESFTGPTRFFRPPFRILQEFAGCLHPIVEKDFLNGLDDVRERQTSCVSLFGFRRLIGRHSLSNGKKFIHGLDEVFLRILLEIGEVLGAKRCNDLLAQP
jgi:hypothetical protein